MDRALVHLDRALAANAANVKALTLKAAVLRHLNRKQEAGGGWLAALRRWILWIPGRPGRRRLTRRGSAGHAATIRRRAWRPADGLCGGGVVAGRGRRSSQAATGKAAADPMVNYFLAFYLEKVGPDGRSRSAMDAAAQASPDYVFPFRREAIRGIGAGEGAQRGRRTRGLLSGQSAPCCMVAGTEAIRQWEDVARPGPRACRGPPQSGAGLRAACRAG